MSSEMRTWMRLVEGKMFRARYHWPAGPASIIYSIHPINSHLTTFRIIIDETGDETELFGRYETIAPGIQTQVNSLTIDFNVTFGGPVHGTVGASMTFRATDVDQFNEYNSQSLFNRCANEVIQIGNRLALQGPVSRPIRGPAFSGPLPKVSHVGETVGLFFNSHSETWANQIFELFQKGMPWT